MPSLKAYEVREDMEGHCVIVFATNNATARREGASELETDWESIESCHRKPQFDGYAPGPVPKLVLLEHGWWFECDRWECQRRIALDDVYGEEGDPQVEPVAMGRKVFCCAECCGRHGAWVRANQAAKAALCDLVMTRWPMANVVRVHVYGDRLTPPEYRDGRLVGGIPCTASFRLPGLQDAVDYHFGEPHLWVTRRDEEAFRASYASKGDKP